MFRSSDTRVPGWKCWTDCGVWQQIGYLKHTPFDVFSTVHHSRELFHQPTLMHNFLYSLTTCLLHYYPRHVSGINMPIFRRKFCIHTASGIFALCKRLHSTLVESGLLLV